MMWDRSNVFDGWVHAHILKLLADVHFRGERFTT